MFIIYKFYVQFEDKINHASYFILFMIHNERIFFYFLLKQKLIILNNKKLNKLIFFNPILIYHIIRFHYKF